jgi:hypothetical protein
MFNNKPSFFEIAKATQRHHYGNVRDLSSEATTRLQMRCRNGLSLSVIQGPYSYGSKKGLFEIAVLTPDGKFATSAFDDANDDVLGWMSQSDVIKKMGDLAQLTPDRIG